MTQFAITKGPGGMEIMFALFDPQHSRTVKFTVQGKMWGKQSHESMAPGEDKIRREVFDEDILPHEVEVAVQSLARPSRQPALWILDGQTIGESPQPISCSFSSVTRRGSAYVGEDAIEMRIWRAQRPELW